MSFEFPLPSDYEWIRNNPEPDTANGTKMTEWIQWKMRHPFLNNDNADYTLELDLLLKMQDDYIASICSVQHPMGHADKAEPEKFDWHVNVTCIEKHPIDVPFTHVYGANVIVSKANRKCDCSRQQLMRDGCKCGGI